MAPTRDTEAPTVLVGRFVRYVSGFMVGVGVGLAPFLGKVRVRGFTALLEIMPFQLQALLIPLSAFLMGLLAVAVQFYAGEKWKPEVLRQRFRFVFISILAGFVVLVIIYPFFVKRVRLFTGEDVAVVVTSERLSTCKCPADSPDQLCIQLLSLDTDALATCWGGPSLVWRELALEIPYLILTSGVGALIGLLLLQEEIKKQRRRRSSSSDKRSAKLDAVAPPTSGPA